MSFRSRLSLRVELLAALTLMALMPAVIVHLHASHRLGRLVRHEVAGYGQQIVDRAAGELEMLVAQAQAAQQQIVAHVLDSPHFRRADALSFREHRQVAEKTDAYLKAVKWSFPFISAIYVINWDQSVYSSYSSAGASGNQYYSGKRLRDASWIRSIAKQPLSEVVVAPLIPPYVYPNTSHQTPVVPFAKNFDTFGRSELNTIVQIDLDYHYIESLLAGVDLGREGLVALVDSQGLIVACPTAKHLVGLDLEDAGLVTDRGINSDDGQILVRHALESIDWALVGVIPAERILTQYRPLRLIMYLVFVVVVIGGIVAAAFISSRLTSPITRFMQSLKRLTEGDTDVDIPDAPTKELQTMSDTVEAIIADMNRLMQESLVKDRERKQAEHRIEALFRMLAQARSRAEKMLCDHERIEELSGRVHKYEQMLRINNGATPAPTCPASKDARIGKVLSYIEDWYDDPNLCLSEAASLVFMEPTYFSSKFKKEIGTGFSVYLRQLRMERAVALLKNPELKICDVARMVGYGDAHYFSRVFTRLNGCHPSEYRRSVTVNSK